LREERLYFFQLPSPFPTFLSPTASNLASPIDDIEVTGKKVAFAKDVKSEPGVSKRVEAQKEEEAPKVDGVIGQLEIYRSGAVKMRLANGILLDVCFPLENQQLIATLTHWFIVGNCSNTTIFPPTSYLSGHCRKATNCPWRS
jgi:hypothetical protein